MYLLLLDLRLRACAKITWNCIMLRLRSAWSALLHTERSRSV